MTGRNDVVIDMCNVVNDVVEAVNDVIMETSNVVYDVVRGGNDVAIEFANVEYDVVRGGDDVVSTSRRPVQMSITMSSGRGTTS